MVVLLLGGLLGTSRPADAFDLERATVEVLESGLTLIVLEEHTLPLVSVQALYRVGAKNEVTGATGLAHFLEHMAFRASEGFPDGQLASALYAVGGEWHAYTWIDQTTYFETVPREHWRLALAIEADRMARLLIPEAEVEPERGAVLTELHGYENDPASPLHDALLAVTFLTHPYRHNTIGWESEVAAIDHAALVDFYRRHYHPGNAVLAVVGDVAAAEVRREVVRLFGTLPKRAPTPPPPTVEPVQRGERRVELRRPGAAPDGERLFEIAWRAPAASAPDWPAFLLLQEILSGGGGVNFAQDGGETPTRTGSRLAGAAEGLATWFPAAAEGYVFTVRGVAPEGASREAVETAIEARIRRLREEPVPAAELARARERVREELVFDLETTEDAAHQLAYFAGLDALEALRGLPAAVARVTAAEVQAAALRYLGPEGRTVGWSVPEARAPHPCPSPSPPTPTSGRGVPEGMSLPPSFPRRRESIPSGPLLRRPLGFARGDNGVAVSPPASPSPGRLVWAGRERGTEGVRIPLPLLLLRRVPNSPAAFLRVVVPVSNLETDEEVSLSHPLEGFTSIDVRFLAGRLDEALALARRALEGAKVGAPAPLSLDPRERLDQSLAAWLGIEGSAGELRPALIVLAGDVDPENDLRVVQAAFADLAPAGPRPLPPLAPGAAPLAVTLPEPRRQSAVGYAVPSVPPGHPDAWAWRLLRYVFAHGYEGRLGKEAIFRRGLVYGLDARDRTDGQRGWVTITTGVDPPKVHAFRALLREMLAGLVAQPPTAAELAEAKRHFLGRWRSEAQSGEEISAALAREWLTRGRLLTEEEVAAEVEHVTAADLARIAPAFAAGAAVVVGAQGCDPGAAER
ncbi:MAG TPA: insulinase family protein [Thermoanaerobaculia bacterium]|nr:insulinase family protein [Thermoanaerobaculia bacterium]